MLLQESLHAQLASLVGNDQSLALFAGDRLDGAFEPVVLLQGLALVCQSGLGDHRVLHQLECDLAGEVIGDLALAGQAPLPGLEA